jgi:excisionase family DNA binding protein
MWTYYVTQCKIRIDKRTGGKQVKEYITIEELTEKLKVSRQTIYLWRKEGLPFIKINRSVRFDLDAVNEWITARSNIENE